MPRVTVMIPVHNAAPFLREALASVVAQTFEDYEVVCLDDGSTDDSGDILRAFAASDPRWRVLAPGRVGLIEAANQLAHAATGEYWARFDADDRMDPQRLALQVAWLDRDPKLDVVSSLVRHFPDADVRGGSRRYEAWLNETRTAEEIDREFFVELPVPNPSAMMRREVFTRAGGYRDDGLPEDYDFWLRAWQSGARFAKVPEVLHYWREHPQRVTRTHPRYSVQNFLRAKVAALLRGPLADDSPFVVWGAGMLGRRLIKLLIQAGRVPVAVLDIDPQKIGRTRHGRPVLAPEAWRPGSTLCLAAVGAAGARAAIRQRLTDWELVETRDFWMVA